MLVFDKQGHTLLAEAVKAKTYYLALADKTNAWSYNNVPRYASNPLAIYAYVKEHDKFYVKESTTGAIEFNGKRYARTSTPTNQINLSFKIKGVDLKDRYMRQQIVVANIVALKPKIFLEKNEANATKMVRLVGENLSPEKIEPASSEVVNYILTF